MHSLLVPETPVGPLLLEGSDTALTAVRFLDRGEAPPAGGSSSPALVKAAAQLLEYFQGRRRTFDLPLAPKGTAFQRTVWDEVSGIPFGMTSTYGRIAERLGKPRAVRAVGAANGRNPIPIIIPCHRVIGSDGRLTGYAGGLNRKAALLALEGATFQTENSPAQFGLPMA